MTSDRAAKYYANLTRELFVLEQIIEGKDDDPPTYSELHAEALRLPKEQVSAKIDDVQYDKILAVRRAHRITRWIGADGAHLSTPRPWPSSENDVIER